MGIFKHLGSRLTETCVEPTPTLEGLRENPGFCTRGPWSLLARPYPLPWRNSFQPRVLFQPSAFFLPTGHIFLLLALVPLPQSYWTSLVWPREASSSTALRLTPAWWITPETGDHSGHWNGDLQGRRQNRPNILKLLHNSLAPLPPSSFLQGAQAAPARRSHSLGHYKVAWAAAQSSCSTRIAVCCPLPPLMIHLMVTQKWNQEIFLNINVKLYHLFDWV